MSSVKALDFWGGNLLDYTGNLSMPTASVTTAKCLLDSVISTPKKMASIYTITYLNLSI